MSLIWERLQESATGQLKMTNQAENTTLLLSLQQNFPEFSALSDTEASVNFFVHY